MANQQPNKPADSRGGRVTITEGNSGNPPGETAKRGVTPPPPPKKEGK